MSRAKPESMPKTMIAIPVYNAKKHIERTLKDQLKRDKNKNILNKTFQLDDNSMFIMAGCSQRYWCHSIQKDDSKDERYSFSIRGYL